MMNLVEPLLLALAFGGGLVLGTAFHLGLWWTVRCGLDAKRSALWFPASLLLRMGGTLAGFYLIGAGRWERYMACLAGFLVARMLVTRFAPSVTARAHRSTARAS